MKLIFFKCFVIFKTLCFISNSLFSQSLLGVKGGNYIGLEAGTQNSGIRKEDFVSSNFTPKFGVYVGKVVNNVLSVQMGYEGFYFKTIANLDKRYYHYYNLKLENIIYTFKSSKLNNKIGFQIGGGLFDNKYYNRPNIVADVGINGAIEIQKKTFLNLKINSIMGWDLYQGDEDIINSFCLGINRIL